MLALLMSIASLGVVASLKVLGFRGCPIDANIGEVSMYSVDTEIIGTSNNIQSASVFGLTNVFPCSRDPLFHNRLLGVGFHGVYDGSLRQIASLITGGVRGWRVDVPHHDMPYCYHGKSQGLSVIAECYLNFVRNLICRPSDGFDPVRIHKRSIAQNLFVDALRHQSALFAGLISVHDYCDHSDRQNRSIPFIYAVGFLCALVLIYFGGFGHITYPPLETKRLVIGVVFIIAGLLVAALTCAIAESPWVTGRCFSSSLSMVVQFLGQSASKLQRLAVAEAPPKEERVKDSFGGSAIADSTVDRHPLFVLFQDLVSRLVDFRPDQKAERRSFTVPYDRVIDLLSLIRPIRNRRIIFAIWKLWRIEGLSVSDVVDNIGWTDAEVLNFDPKTEIVEICFDIIGKRLVQIDIGNKQKRSIYIERGFGRFLHVLGNADQLTVEDSHRYGRSGHHGSQENHQARIILAVPTGVAGTWCLVWGLRQAGSCDWRWVILG